MCGFMQRKLELNLSIRWRKQKVCCKPLFFVSMSCLGSLVCKDNTEILCHLESLLRRRTTSDSSSEFLKTEIKQIKTVQNNCYGTKLT